MRLRLIKKMVVWLPLLLWLSFAPQVNAQTLTKDATTTIDRIQLVTRQIELLNNRLAQANTELTELQQLHDKHLSEFTIENASKNLLDKAALDISVSKSNLDSVTIELADSQQTVIWLEKNIQEIENQLNVLGIFGLKVSRHDLANVRELRGDLNYQQKLIAFQKERVKLLQQLQTTANNIMQLRTDKYNRLNTLLKSQRMLHIKQQQVKEELAYQQQQHHWLNQLDLAYARLAKIDPQTAKHDYALVEREIFIANENAAFAYFQSLLARYRDQIQQMKLAVLKNNSISLLNEIGDQVQVLNKQMARLDATLRGRADILGKHVAYLSKKKSKLVEMQPYIAKLNKLEDQYQTAATDVMTLNKSLLTFRTMLEQALQTELSARQGFPTFSLKTFLDIGKEILLVPALTFQIIKSLSGYFVRAFQSATLFTWSFFAFGEFLIFVTYMFLRDVLSSVLARPSQWREKMNSKWLSLQWLRRNLLDISIIANIMGLLWLIDVPLQNFIFITYLSLAWLIFKSIITIARLCLVETTHDSQGHDMRLYQRLKWVILVAALITGITVFVHQLPLIYEVKTLCDRIFLFLMMIVSLFLLRSSDVVPNLILSHMETQHPYLQKSIHLIGILVPLLIFGNSIIGLVGYVNLIMTVSWYEGVFLIVLIGYLIVRGLLSDSMELLSRLMIQYANNGWLWTEAFLKPLDKVLRITLFFTAWAVLFLCYGWDKQSPIVERFWGMLHYQLVSVFNTTITPMSILELCVLISVFYWTAKWTREFVYRLLSSRTKDMGIRNSIAILSQYSMVMMGAFICLRVLGIDLQAVAMVASLFAFGIGFGLRDLANNFVCGFLILFERPLRVGDIVSVNDIEGEVTNIGSRAVAIRTWDNMELLVPNAEIFNKSFTNWTAQDNVVRSIGNIKISRHDNPHEVKILIQNILLNQKDILKDPPPEVLLKAMTDILIEFEIRYFVNIRQVRSRVSVMSAVLMTIWDEFLTHGIKPAYPQHEVFVKEEAPIKRSIPALKGVSE